MTMTHEEVQLQSTCRTSENILSYYCFLRIFRTFRTFIVSGTQDSCCNWCCLAFVGQFKVILTHVLLEMRPVLTKLNLASIHPGCNEYHEKECCILSKGPQNIFRALLIFADIQIWPISLIWFPIWTPCSDSNSSTQVILSCVNLGCEWLRHS